MKMSVHLIARTTLNPAVDRSIEEKESLKYFNIVMEVPGMSDEEVVRVCGEEAPRARAVVVLRSRRELAEWVWARTGIRLETLCLLKKKKLPGYTILMFV